MVPPAPRGGSRCLWRWLFLRQLYLMAFPSNCSPPRAKHQLSAPARDEDGLKRRAGCRMVLENMVQLHPQSLCLPDGCIEAGSLCCAQNLQEFFGT